MHSIIKYYLSQTKNNGSTSPASRRSLPSGFGRHAGACRGSRGVGNRLLGFLGFGRSLLGRWAVPVNEHLKGEDGVECESSHEAVENELVVHFLEGGKDARQGAEEVVENLEKSISFIVLKNTREKKKTYCKCTQLSSAAFTPDGDDLRELAGHAESAGASL